MATNPSNHLGDVISPDDVLGNSSQVRRSCMVEAIPSDDWHSVATATTAEMRNQHRWMPVNVVSKQCDMGGQAFRQLASRCGTIDAHLVDHIKNFVEMVFCEILFNCTAIFKDHVFSTFALWLPALLNSDLFQPLLDNFFAMFRLDCATEVFFRHVGEEITMEEDQGALIAVPVGRTNQATIQTALSNAREVTLRSFNFLGFFLVIFIEEIC